MVPHDVRFGLRMLRKNPGFTLTAVLALTLGIASTTAMFSIVDGVLLRPLPYPNPGQLVNIAQTVRSTGVSTHDSSPANYLDWVAQSDVFSHIAATSGIQSTLSGGDRPERIRVTITSSDYFPLFGVAAVTGRTLNSQDSRSGNDHVAVLGYDLWQSRFGGQSDIVGREIQLNGERFTVVGVMPRNFSPDNYAQMWIPSPWDVPPHPLLPGQDPTKLRSRNYLEVWARLKPAVPISQARAQMNSIAARLEAQYPNDNQDTGVSVTSMHDETVGNVRPALITLIGAVAFLLLIGCVNVANLLLSRAAARDREIAIRFALGASRARLVRQLLTESTLLGLLGGAAGVMVASWAVPVLVSLGPAGLRAFPDLGLNRHVLVFSVGISLLTGLIFGSVPAIYSSFFRPNESLAQTERGGTVGHRRGRSILIVAEIALSLVLLIGAGLMMKSFSQVMRVNPGFVPDNLLVFNIAPPPSADPAHQKIFYQDVVERISALPGVKSVGAVNRLPLAGGNSARSFNVVGSDKSHDADLRIATPNYFRTLGIPTLRGRTFNEAEAADGHVIVVNEALARTVFPNQDPIGKFIVQGPENTTCQIVGVVGNVRHAQLENQPNSEIYHPLTQVSWPSMFVAVRADHLAPLSLLPSVQEAVWSVDKTVALSSVRTMEDLIGRSVANRKFTMLVLSSFAAMAMVLAAIGLFGVMSYSVVQRAREIGVRMALGAQRSDIFSLIVREGMSLTVVGLVLGIGSAIAMTRLISGLLFGISATDFSTFALLSGLLGFVAFIACWWPAHRASQVDPVITLRAE